MDKFTYDAGGNLITQTSTYNNETPTIYTYQRGSQAATEIQKYIKRLAGDLLWFYRAKLFTFEYNDYFFAGNALESVKRNNAPWYTYTNEFDGNGNLKKMSSFFSLDNTTNITEFEYRP